MDARLRLGIGDNLLDAVLGYLVVFIGLTLLMLVIIIVGKVMVAKSKKADNKSAAPAAEPEQPQEQPAHKLDASGAPVSALDEKIEKAAESLEQIRPEMSGELMSITMESALKEGRPPLQIEKTVTPAPEGAKEKEEKKDEDAVTE